MTAALSVAAHAAAGGGLPSGAATILLALLAITVGVLVASIRDAADVTILAGLLAVGQLLGHVVLGAGGHEHAAAGAPWGLMLAAHVAAVTIAATLIAAGGHLCAAMSRVLRVASAPMPGPVTVLPRRIVGADQPLRSALQLAASMSHRGPPVGFAH